jgi:transcription termination factor NusB
MKLNLCFIFGKIFGQKKDDEVYDYMSSRRESRECSLQMLYTADSSNAFIERFNKTIKEQFVYRNEDCMNDCDLANKKIKDWLFWYNTQIGRKSLNYKTSLHCSQLL